MKSLMEHIIFEIQLYIQISIVMNFTKYQEFGILAVGCPERSQAADSWCLSQASLRRLANRCQTVCSAEEASGALVADRFDVHVVDKGGAGAFPSTLTV